MTTTLTSVTNHFPSPQDGFTTTLSGSIGSGATTVGLNSVAGYTNGQTAVFIVDPSDPIKKQTFTGVIDTSGIQVTNVVWTAGTNVAHSAGATVVDYASATHVGMMSKGLLVEHDQDGGHGAITPSSVNTTTLTATSGTFTNLTITGTATSEGWSPLGQTPNTVTYNGNRNYDLVFNSVDLTSTLSPGMRLKATRTVAAPTQCTSLNGTTQGFSKATPSGVTFTNTWTVTAWIKISSYSTTNYIMSRGTGANDGWQFYIDTTGRLVSIFRGAGATYKNTQSYASVPLNKWVHVAITHTASTNVSTMYLDGVSIENQSLVSGGTPPTTVIQAGDLTVGGWVSSFTFSGKIAQAAVYSAVLSAATIKASANQTLSGSETSLISAYSFNGVITDLNTTNANNLTAQGSAVATNADSPFANAVTAGLLEYAEVNSVTFSTNTTVNVRVPDSSLLPTSGGVSAMSYATTANPYGLPFFTKILAYVRATASFTTTIAGADISGLTSTVYVPQNGTIKISLWVGRVTNVSGAGVETTANLFSDGVTDIGANGPNVNNSASAGPISLSYIRTPTVGNHTYKFQGQNSGSNTGVTFNTGAYLTIELI